MSTNDAYIEEIKQFRYKINRIVNNIPSKKATLSNTRTKEKQVHSNSYVIDIESEPNMEEEDTSNTNNNTDQPIS